MGKKTNSSSVSRATFWKIYEDFLSHEVSCSEWKALKIHVQVSSVSRLWMTIMFAFAPCEPDFGSNLRGATCGLDLLSACCLVVKLTFGFRFYLLLSQADFNSAVKRVESLQCAQTCHCSTLIKRILSEKSESLYHSQFTACGIWEGFLNFPCNARVKHETLMNITWACFVNEVKQCEFGFISNFILFLFWVVSIVKLIRAWSNIWFKFYSLTFALKGPITCWGVSCIERENYWF